MSLRKPHGSNEVVRPLGGDCDSCIYTIVTTEQDFSASSLQN